MLTRLTVSLVLALVPLAAWNLNQTPSSKTKVPQPAGAAVSPVESHRLYTDDTKNPERSLTLLRIRTIKKEIELLQADSEAYQIFMAAKRAAKVPGDLVEVGVYKGGSAKLICQAKGKKLLHLFDTFEGIPAVQEIDKEKVSKSQYPASLEGVKTYLKDCEQVSFYKGFFPDTAGPLKTKRLSFVHLDVDTYESTRKSLEFVYPRMSKGGVIISHDYTWLPGVRKAVDDFFRDKPETVIEFLGSTQCLIVKL